MNRNLHQIFTVSVVAVATLCAQMVTSARADGPVDLKVGDAAPAFEVKDDSGQDWKSSDHIGKKVVVVYFYPADMTGGCTKQACGFRDDMKTLTDKGVEVVGVSGDSVRNHQLFKKEYGLNFPLLADTEGKVAEKFGVPMSKGEKKVETKIDGKDETFIRNVTIQRWTFVIDKSGKIAAKNSMVKAAEDSKAILELVEKLK
ncbi:peroxiredoxin [Schlesneria paludicola]|uniref:peroxiredoxin n=1 Tax=Schlesneria paludicola TaxID=360056 RepID=UPI00029AA23D|nr:peroxiredoxin [Schlesneria paludicola]